MISDKLCIRCKGKLMCGLSRCPLYDRMREFRRPGLRRELEAPSPPHYLVSWRGYPRVSVGPSLSLRDVPGEAFDMQLEDFVARRANQLRAYQVKGIRNAEEESLSVDPVRFSARLKSLPSSRRPSTHGLQAPADRLTVEDGVKVPGKVYSIVDSHDLKAQGALRELQDYGFDYMVRALSTGNLGLPSQRKMVPTRWAITAVDSTLAKDYFGEIRGKRQVTDYELYRMDHWDNHFWVVLAPWSWGFEMLEQWHGGDVIRDWEYGRLKKSYAKNITGAYYAARLEVLKHLAGRGRLAACLVVRQIGRDYVYPVGVWHIRDAVRRALEGRPEKFSSLAGLRERLGEDMDWGRWGGRSKLWKFLSRQSKLEDFV